MTSTHDDAAPAVATREVRLLEGPNLYFPRPAVKVTLALPGYLAAPPEAVRAVSGALGLRRSQPGAEGSAQRQQAVVRVVERAARLLAAAAGTGRLGVRTRAAAETDVVVCASARCSPTSSPVTPSRMPWRAGPRTSPPRPPETARGS